MSNHAIQSQPTGMEIAVIAMAGRFPGARSIDELWQNLRNGVESVIRFSDEELKSSGMDPRFFKHPNYIPVGAFLHDVDQFDAGFFGYSPREAAMLDPQHRLFLECCHEAIESAGYSPDQGATSIGLFGGVGKSTYLNQPNVDPEAVESVGALQLLMATDKDFLTTRVSYKLNLEGPSVNVQTACSTSLVAVHMACQSLLSGECDMALAGGASIIFPQKTGYIYNPGGILSADGHCRPFDAKSNGTISSTGIAVVMLKRLEDALNDGDTIHAVIRGSAINNDGSLKVGYTAPRADGQAKVIRAAQMMAEVEPETITYIETHGTGTELGDPIEVAALTQAFGTGGRRGQFCGIGSLKSNMGHLDAAAGAAGLIKAVLALRHRELPPSLHYESPNPEIDFANSPFYVVDRLRPWETAPGQPRRAGVSSFGIGGTNAHVVLEEAPEPAPSLPSRPWQLLTFSARSTAALEQAAQRLAAHLEAHPGLELADAAWTLQVGRKAHEQRRVVVARDRAAAMAALASGGGISGAATGTAPRVGFLFTGQGAQYAGMGRALYEHEPVYRAAVDECCELLKTHLRGPWPVSVAGTPSQSAADAADTLPPACGGAGGGLDLRELLYPSPSPSPDSSLQTAECLLRQTALTQPALFVTEYALARLWMSWGIEPAAMLGHSIGEWVAAHLAGVMELATALELVATRGRLMGQMPTGAMLAVSLSEAELAPLLGEELALATINGPGQCVASGPEAAIARLEARLQERGAQSKRLETSHAFHSAMMEPAAAGLKAALARAKLQPPRTPFVSNVTGTWITPEEATDPGYWARQLRQAVRFAQGLATLVQSAGATALLEVGPGRVLSALARSHPAVLEKETLIVRSLPQAREEREGRELMLESLGRLWLAGVQPRWEGLYAEGRRRRVPLPTYPFERKRYWIQTRDAHQDRNRTRATGAGTAPDVADWFYVPSWRRSALATAKQEIQGPWLIFSDEAGAGEALARRLRARGEQVVQVRPGAGFVRHGAEAYTIGPERREDYTSLLQALSAAPPRQIVHLWSYGEPPATVAQAQGPGFYSLLWLAQALAGAGWSHAISLLVGTSHVQEVTGAETLAPGRATVLGPCRVLGLELPGVRCAAVDLESEPEPAAAALLAEAGASAREPEVAYRHGWRWVRDYEPLRLEASQQIPARLRQQGVYLITGGLGGVGLALAQWLAQSLQARLVLVGRTGLPPREVWPALLSSSPPPAGGQGGPSGNNGPSAQAAARVRAVQALEQEGAQVLTLAADVADAAQMRAAVETARQHFGALHGIIHAAGIPGGGILMRQTPEMVEKVFAAKVCGTQVIGELAQTANLDFLVLCSSLVSQVALAGRGEYTAANLFVDAYARWLQTRIQIPVTTINWDTWREVGMAVNAAMEREQTSEAPVLHEGMMTEEGIDAFCRVLDSGLPQVIVSTQDLLHIVEAKKRQALKVLEPSAGVEAIQESGATALHQRPDLKSEYVAPATDAEKKLAAIWSKLLGIGQIGIHDNFFELGGDSVISIQIIAKANQAGLKLTPKQVFDHQTIAELATVAGQAQETRVEADIETGEVPLTPIQHWFFAQDFADPHHFNQAMLMAVKQRVEDDALHKVVGYLLDQHPALRMRYQREGGTWRQSITAARDEVPYQRIDLSQIPESQQSAVVLRTATEMQASLDLVHGPLLRLVYMDLGSDRPGRLLFTVHHLVMDAISWRILLEDFYQAWNQIRAGRTVELPPKTTSLRRWAERLEQYAQSPQARDEFDYWSAMADHTYSSLPVDMRDGSNMPDGEKTVKCALSEEETNELLHDVPSVYNTQIDDVLLTALARTFSEWTGENSLLLTMEGHGREAILDDVDPSRTVGWFTSMFPVRLSLEDGMDDRDALLAIKEQMRRIPNHGIGFGVLRFLNRESSVRETLSRIPRPEVVYLNLGRFQEREGDGALLGKAPESSGPERSARNHRTQLLEVNAVISGGRLLMIWRYCSNLHRRETIASLSERCLTAVRDLIKHCRSVESGAYSPSDFPEADLSQKELDDLLADYESLRESK